MRNRHPSKHKPDIFRYICTFIWAILLGLTVYSTGLAQSAPEWLNPTNLSKSGAASQSRLLALPDGGLQAFWWDRFDGLMTSTAGSNGVWSEPVVSRIRSNNLKSTPELFIDPAGVIYAFWTESQSSGSASGQEALMYSQVNLGETTWTIPAKLTNSVVDFDVQRSESGELRMVYIRLLNTEKEPAGVYLLKKATPRARWSNPILIHASKYLRLLTPETAQLDLSLTGSPTTTQVDYLQWFDPLSGEVVLAFSTDGGATWNEPQVLQAEDQAFTTPRLIPGEPAYLSWQTMLQGSCSIFQQEIMLPENAEASQVLQFGPLAPIMERISECPNGEERFETIDGRLFWIWGEATSRMSLAARDNTQNQWTLPNSFSVSFEDSLTGQSVSLDDLHSSLVGEQLYLIGADTRSGEVWFAQAGESALDLAYAEPSPWSEAQPVPLGGQSADAPAMVVDGKGRTHSVWSVSPSPSGPGASLFYAQSSPNGILGPFELVPAAKGNVARQPALYYEAGREILHLVWSGGTDGSLLYSWVGVDEAGSSAAWLPPTTLSTLADASWPQIAQDSSGTMYVLYAVPLNEARGIYLSRSTDKGQSWAEPVLVFDPVQNQVPMVAYPTLAVGPDGRLHAAWVNAQAPGVGGSQSLQYSLSPDGGDTWSAPMILAAEGFSYPHLAMAADQLHLLYASEKVGLSAIYQRFVGADQDTLDSAAWSPPMAIPGWRNVVLPYGLATSGFGGPGSSLYLLGADFSDGILYYATWDGERWTPIESHAEISVIEKGLGVGAAAPALGGQLSVGWMGYPVQQEEDASIEPNLFLISRLIPTLSASTAIQPASTPIPPTPSATPEPTPQPTVVPSPTPELNAPVQSSSIPLPLPPMALGGILVGIMVALIFGGRYLLKRIDSRHH
jgi:hypothetical protein